MSNENTAIDSIAEDSVTDIPTSTERFLTFMSDGLTIGVSTNYVTEIITNHTITIIPLVPDYVKGIGDRSSRSLISVTAWANRPSTIQVQPVSSS